MVHLNFEPDVQKPLVELRRNPNLWEGLALAKQTRVLSPKMHMELAGFVEIFRDKYRSVLCKPSYRELLRSAFNLLMPQPGQPTFANANSTTAGKHSAEFAQDESPQQPNLSEQAPEVIAAKENTERASDDTSLAHSVISTVASSTEALSRSGGNTEQWAVLDGQKEFVVSDGNSISVAEESSAVDSQLQAAPVLSLPERFGISTDEVERFLLLIVSRLNQEYFEQLSNAGQPDLFSALSKEGNGRDGVVVSVGQGDPVTAIFEQWLAGLGPALSRWRTWISPNGKCSIERCVVLSLPDAEIDPLTQTAKRSLLLDSQLPSDKDRGNEDTVGEGLLPDMGSRIVVLTIQPLEGIAYGAEKLMEGLHRGEEFEDRGARDVIESVRQRLDGWIGSRYFDREAFLVCPSVNSGTRRVPLGILGTKHMRRTVVDRRTEQQFVYFIDSVYKNNENIRLQKLAEFDRLRAPKKVAGAAAKSKRAKMKRLEEEKLRQMVLKKEVEEIMSQIAPDGYYFVKFLSFFFANLCGQESYAWILV